MTKENLNAIRLAGSELGQNRHACAFFNGDDEAYRVLEPFICDGFDCGHKAVHLIKPGQRENHMHRLRCVGVDTVLAEQTGQLEVQTALEAYLPNGRFDQGRLLQKFEGLASGNAEGPFPLSRIVCNMDWAADADVPKLDLIEFESRINEVWSKHDDVVICVYDLAKFSGETIIAILRTHPLAIVGGVLHANPFYIPPAEFLKELGTGHMAGEELLDATG